MRFYIDEHGEKRELSCPDCNSNRVVKNGRTTAGSQRVRCQDCNRSWTTTTFKRTADEIEAMIERINQGQSFQEVAKLFGVVRSTVYYHYRKRYPDVDFSSEEVQARKQELKNIKRAKLGRSTIPITISAEEYRRQLSDFQDLHHQEELRVLREMLRKNGDQADDQSEANSAGSDQNKK